MEPTAICYDITTLNGTITGVPDNSDDPEPIQIMKFTAQSPGEPLKIECNKKKLKNILEKTGNRPVAVLAVTGPTRKGKSFFLNFVLRRLIGIRDGEEDWMGWTKMSEPLVGFTWKANNDRVTDGIWMWSEPFTLNSKHDGSEFDLLLIDTQGVFDEETGKREWSILMGLSLLTSSCLVYNNTHNIDENDLLLLDEFLSFGEMALQDTNNAGKQKPFQNLLFLLRDWGNPSQYPYGSKGGQQFIQNKLQKKSSHQKESSEVRDKLEKCFNNISCILLPHPGPEVINAEYDGSIGSCVTFASEIESAIENILFGGNLPLKTINGNTLTGKELFDLFKTYVELFNDDRMLTSESMYYAACKACNAAVVSKCVTGFIEKVQKMLEDVPVATDKDLKEILKEEKERALRVFERCRKMGSRRIIDEADDLLCTEIKAEFEKLKLNYMARKEQNILNALSMAVLQYGTSMEKVVNGKAFLSEDLLEKNSQSAQTAALDLFISLLKLKKDDEVFTSKRAKLSELMHLKLQEFRSKNGSKKARAEEAIITDVTNLSQLYAENLDLKIRGRTLSDQKLAEYHDKISASLTAEFKQTHAESPLLTNALDRLAAQINDKLVIVRRRFKSTFQEHLAKAQELSTNALCYYNRRMTQENEHELGVNVFNTSHAVANAAAVKILTEFQETIPKEIMLESLTALQSNISHAYVKMLSSFNEKVSKIQTDITGATKAAKKQYKASMTLITGDHYVLEDSYLESQHKEAHHNALTFIEQAIIGTQLTFKEEEKNKIINDYSDAINKWFADLRDANSKKMRDAEKKITEEVQNRITQYEVEKDTSINEVDVIDVDTDDFLDPIIEKIEQEFNDACHRNPLYSQGKQELVQKLKAKREKTKQEIEDAKVLFHKNSSAAVALSLQNYEVKMGKIDLNADDAEFQKIHNQQLTHCVEILQKSEVLLNSKWIDKYQEDLKSKIHESYTKLFANFKHTKIDIEAAIASVKERAKGKYTNGMETYFQESPDPFSNLELLTQHNQEKADAKNYYLQFYPTPKTKNNAFDEELKAGVVELGQEINLMFQNFEEKNKSRIHQVKQVFESTVLPHVQELFKNLEGRLVLDEELPKYQKSITKKCTDHLLSSTESNSHTKQLKEDIIKQIVEEKTKQLQEVHNSVQVTHQQVEELIAETSSSYRNKIIDIIISNSKNDTFEKSHTGLLKAELDKIRNSTAITCPTTAQNIMAKLEPKIEGIYKEISTRKAEFLTEIFKAHEDAVGVYTQGMSGYIKSYGFVEDSEIITKHNIFKNEAKTHLQNDLKKITFYSKTVDWIKSGDVTELETRLGQLLPQAQETNKANKQAAEQRMEAGVKSSVDDYIVDMNLEFNGATLTVEQVQAFHNKISKKSLEKFARVNSKSSLFPKWNDLLTKELQNELHEYQQQISAAEDQTNRVGEALVLDGINSYRETMRDAIKQDEDSFEKTHLLIKKFPVDSLKNTGKISNKDQLAIFVGKLEIQIQNAYEEFSSNISQNRIKIQGVIQRLKQQCIENYGKNIRQNFISQNGHTDDAKLQALHSQELSAAKSKLSQCYNGIQTSSKVFKDQQIPDVESLTESIEVLFQQLKQENNESITQSQNRLNIHIKSSTKKYVEGMALKLNGEFVLGEKFETLHTSVAQPLLENFTLVWSASFLFKEGQERLLKEINSQKNKFNEEMTAAHNAIHESLRLSVQNSVEKYKEEMNIILLEDDQVFSEGHHIHQKEAVETLEKLRNSETEKYINKYESDFQKEILEAQVKLVGDHHRCKMQFGVSLVQAKESAKKNYEAQMNVFFDSIKTYISPSLLEEQHKIKSAEAVVILQDQYKKHQGTRLQDQEENDFLELNENIQHNYEKFQGINNERLRHFQEEQRKHLGGIKENYKQSVKILAETQKTKDDFVRKSEEVMELCENNLQAELKAKHAAVEFTSELVDDLKMYMKDQFKDYLAIFQSRIAQDVAAVTSALIKARQHYNEEMNKRVQAKLWFEPEELSKINTQVIDLSISKCENINLTQDQDAQLREAMAVVYQKYSEDNTLKYPVENPAIGIDLGTTYSCVGVYINGEVQIIPNRDVSDGTTIPSYVSFNRDHTIDVGNSAKDQAFLKPQHTIFDAKRLIGRSFSDPIVQEDIKLWPFSVIDDNDKPKIQVWGKQFRPEEISAKVLIKIKTMAESYLNKEVKEAVVTVPAYFNDGQRQATRDAAEIAGLKVKILNEPTAAAIAYKLHRTDELKRNVLIFDLGGGTFDVAVLEIKGKDIVVKSTGGDTHLGGEDFDNHIVNHIIERVKTNFDRDLARGRDSTVSEEKSKASGRLRRLRDRCEAAKRNLSDTLATIIALDSIDGEFNLEETLTREEFEELNMDLFKKCIDVVQEALDDAKLEKTEIDDIVLVGGSTRIPKVQELLKQFFDNKKELNGKINPDEAVARGAAIQAALIHGEQATSLRDSVALADVTPHSLGTKILGGAMSVIIPKHTSVPCSHKKQFSTTVNDQSSVKCAIYEGEKAVAIENNNLGNFILNNIPPAPAGQQKIECTMTIDDEGILHVKAVCTSNNVQNDIKIETYNGRMTKEEIKMAQTAKPFEW